MGSQLNCNCVSAKILTDSQSESCDSVFLRVGGSLGLLESRIFAEDGKGGRESEGEREGERKGRWVRESEEDWEKKNRNEERGGEENGRKR